MLAWDLRRDSKGRVYALRRGGWGARMASVRMLMGRGSLSIKREYALILDELLTQTAPVWWATY